MTSSDNFSERHRRLYAWFFKEYNNEYINYEKYYRASKYYQKRAKQVRWGVGLLSATVVILVLAIVKGIRPDLLTPIAIGASLGTGVISLVGSIGDFERKYITYYNSGQEHDDLYTEFDNMIKVKLPDPDADYESLENECKRLVDKKDELNGLTPQLEGRWYDKLIEERGKDAVHWDRQPLEKMRVAEFESKDKSDEEAEAS